MPSIEISEELYQELMAFFANQSATQTTWKLYSELMKAKESSSICKSGSQIITKK
jgi:hypothetical protein